VHSFVLEIVTDDVKVPSAFFFREKLAKKRGVLDPGCEGTAVFRKSGCLAVDKA
jgi:hypothetical protein